MRGIPWPARPHACSIVTFNVKKITYRKGNILGRLNFKLVHKVVGFTTAFSYICVIAFFFIYLPVLLLREKIHIKLSQNVFWILHQLLFPRNPVIVYENWEQRQGSLRPSNRVDRPWDVESLFRDL